METKAETKILSESIDVSSLCHYICVPLTDDHWSLIFWTKDGPNNDSPMPDKIVSILL